MYKEGVEDIEHFMLKCKALNDVRAVQQKLFKETVDGIKGGGAELLSVNGELLQAILDCTSRNVKRLFQLKPSELKAIEVASQKLCYELHKTRTKLMCDI